MKKDHTPEQIMNRLRETWCVQVSQGKDYLEGRIIQPQRGTPWMEMEEYRKLYSTFKKLKPAWNPPRKGKR